MPPDRLGRRRRHHRDVKDRLVQTRVPERLETVLKEEAQKRRLTVSHLIRNMLEDTLQLVDTVVAGAEGLAFGSVDLAEQVKRDAEKIASTAREAVRSRTSAVKEARRDPSDESKPTAPPRPDVQPATPDLATSRAGSARVSEAPDPGSVPAPAAALSNAPARPPPTAVNPNKIAALDHVLGWNQLVVNRPARCASCDIELPRGVSAHLGVSSNPSATPTWLCDACLELL